jgi:hypothetical protein
MRCDRFVQKGMLKASTCLLSLMGDALGGTVTLA